MILVVADTSPIHYLVLIEAVQVLPQLFDRVVIPQAVLAELSHAHAPACRSGLGRCAASRAEVRTAARVDLAGVLDPGEAEAIALAQELGADSVLLDELEGREEALRRGLPVAGTVGVLERAAERGFISLPQALQRLGQTNFHITHELLQQALARDAARRQRHERERGLER